MRIRFVDFKIAKLFPREYSQRRFPRPLYQVAKIVRDSVKPQDVRKGIHLGRDSGVADEFIAVAGHETQSYSHPIFQKSSLSRTARFQAPRARREPAKTKLKRIARQQPQVTEGRRFGQTLASLKTGKNDGRNAGQHTASSRIAPLK